MTKMEIKRSGLDIENRDIQKNRYYEKELIRQGGKRQVPCLRIESLDGKIQWLYESGDINQWIKQYSQA
jgi:glutaredoxin